MSKKSASFPLMVICIVVFAVITVSVVGVISLDTHNPHNYAVRNVNCKLSLRHNGKIIFISQHLCLL